MLHSVPLFSHIPEEKLRDLEQSAVVRKYPKNTLLFFEGDEGGQMYVVKQGLLYAYTDDDDGRQLVLNYLAPGDYFGELSLIDNQPRSATVAAVDDSEVLCISRDRFRHFLSVYPELYDTLLIAMAQRVRELTHNVKDMALLDVYGRVAQTLERLCRDELEPPKLTHQSIANMVGASREMVSRVMKELVVGGYIQIEQKHIRILKKFPKNW